MFRKILLGVMAVQLVVWVKPSFLPSQVDGVLERWVPVNVAFMLFVLHIMGYSFGFLSRFLPGLSLPKHAMPVVAGVVAYALTWHPVASGTVQPFAAALNSCPEWLKIGISVLSFVHSMDTLSGKADSTTGSSTAVRDANITCPASSDTAMDFDLPKVIPESDKELFFLMFDRICNEIVEDLPTTYEMPEEPTEWIRNMMEYTVAGGKMNRGLAAMACRATLAEARGKKLTDRERCQSAALGWCIEFLQAFFLVADDIMDASITRRGKDCWYRLPDVKLIAINDSFILESCVYKILKRYCGTNPCYPQLLDLFIEVTRQTELGQLMDLTSQPLDGPTDLSRFTMERMTKITKYKTAFYSFYLPVALAMIEGGITDRAVFDKAREVLCIMGEYFQIQDDYLDCYGTPEQIGKVGTDIQDNKCSWLVVTALANCNATQKRTLLKNYGRDDPGCIEAVKKLYGKLNLAEQYHEYEEASYAKIQSILDETTELPREVFEFLLRKIYKRSK